MSSPDPDTGIGECFRGNLSNGGCQKEVARNNDEYIKKEHKSLKFQYCIGQRDVLKWVLEE